MRTEGRQADNKYSDTLVHRWTAFVRIPLLELVVVSIQGRDLGLGDHISKVADTA